jgi:hypothetical protein
MNCCDTYGTCQQGRDCPARTGTVLPHQAAHARRKEENNAAKETGNVWFYEPPPVELTIWETITIYCTLAILSVISIGLLAAGGRYLYLQLFN